MLAGDIVNVSVVLVFDSVDRLINSFETAPGYLGLKGGA